MKYLTLLLLYFCTLLLPSLAEAATYWASVSGGAASCAAASGTSDPGQYRTLAQALDLSTGCLKAGNGDTLIIKAGTYSNTQLRVPSGTSGAHTTIRSDTTGTVVFTGAQSFDLYSNNTSYVDFIGNRTTLNLTFDGTSLGGNENAFAICQTSRKSDCPGENHHITFDGVRVHHWGGMGFTTYSADNTFKYSRFDHNGIYPDGLPGYAFYISGGSNNNIVEYSEIDGSGGYGVHIYSGYAENATNNIIRFNRIHANGQAAVTQASDYGMLLGGGGSGLGSGNQAYGNVVYSEPKGGIVVSYNCTDCLVYNNTIYGSSGVGLQINDATGTLVRNNISSNNSTNISNAGTSTTFQTNLCSVAGTGCATSEAAASTFNDAANANFALKAGSLALDAGTTLSSPYNTAIDGTTRPQGSAFDLGAYETSTSAPSCPAVSPALVASYGFEGNGNDSTGVNTATLGSGWSYTTGKYGQGALSTGLSGITVADANALDVCGGFTYEGWINIASVAANHVFIVKNPDSKTFLFASINGYCGLGTPMGGYTQADTQPVACYDTPTTTGSFQHLALTYDSSLGSANLKLYLNGNLVTSANGTALLDATTGTLQFCTSGFGETCPSGTVIDEVRIYNYARSAAQITTDMNTPIVPLAAPSLKVSGTMKFGAGSAALKLPGGS